MPRPKRITKGNIVYHVLNRANGRLRIFKKPQDFAAFEAILAEGVDRFEMRLCSYCIMSNHWHLVLWPRNDGDLSNFVRWITLTHAQRFHFSHKTVGIGHLYQGRYKSFPIQNDIRYLKTMRYIEANPLRAGMVSSASDWPWSSLAIRCGAESEIVLSKGPKRLPNDWPRLVNCTIDQDEIDGIENCIKRGCPYGSKQWVTAKAKELNLESTIRPRGRPKIQR
jgi:REP-associated tyrosine transposase